ILKPKVVPSRRRAQAASPQPATAPRGRWEARDGGELPRQHTPFFPGRSRHPIPANSFYSVKSFYFPPKNSPPAYAHGLHFPSQPPIGQKHASQIDSLAALTEQIHANKIILNKKLKRDYAGETQFSDNDHL
ncbi:unnamed protein product, partial [Ectocarpus sp. 12 AP-2014]